MTSWRSSATVCAGTSRPSAHFLFQGPEGNALLHDVGVATENLEPQHQWVPWIVVNGKFSQANQEAAQAGAAQWFGHRVTIAVDILV